MSKSSAAALSFTRLIFAALLLNTLPALARQSDDARDLPPDQTIEREIKGAETHRYKIDLKADDFFQVRAEQKGVDVSLKLSDAGGNVFTTMDSLNGKEGFETLSFVSAAGGSFILEVSNADAKVERAVYTLKREAPRAATARDRRRVEVERVYVEATRLLRTKGQAESGLAKLEEALKGWQELGDRYLAESTGQSIKHLRKSAALVRLFEELKKADEVRKQGAALALRSKADSLSARAKANEALKMYRALDAKLHDKVFVDEINRPGEATDWHREFLSELQYFVKSSVASCFDDLAQTHYNLGEWQQEVDYLKLALAGYREISADASFNAVIEPRTFLRIKTLIAGKLRRIGDSLDNLGRPAEALDYLNQSLESFRSSYKESQSADDKFREADALRKIGLIHGRESGGSAKAIEFFNKALEIYRASPGKKDEEASIISLIALQHMNDFRYGEAIKNFEAALGIYRELDNKYYQAQILQTIGGIHSVLNNKAKVGEYVNQSLLLLQSPDFVENWLKHYAKDMTGLEVYVEAYRAFIEYQRLDAIGYSYRLLEDYPKSLDYYEKSLAVAASGKDLGRLRLNLRDVGFTQGKLNRWAEAADYYRRALAISRGQGVREDTARDLQDMGWMLREAGRPREALSYQNEALLTYRSAGVAEDRTFSPTFSSLLNELSRTHDALGNRRLAIFYGKRGVNALQGERQRLRNLDPVSQKGFLEKQEKHYRRLADWLITEGRLPEAEQVLQMLKEEEVYDYLRRDAAEGDRLQKRASLSDKERDALKRYYDIADRIAANGAEFGRLQELKAKGLTAEQQKRFDQLSKQTQAGNRIFEGFLSQLAREFSKRANVEKDLRDNLGLKSDMKEWGEGVVFLYTLVGDDRYRVILTTTKARTDGKYEIKAAALNKKIAAFLAAVKNPAQDPRPLGKELYDILIKPIEKELDGARATTLLWSLDGNLRLLPLAALWDGERYFGQRYQNVTVTLASRTRLGREVAPGGRALGLGVTQSKLVKEPDGTREIPFPALPAVERELNSIVRNDKSPRGVLPGQILLDAEFNEAALKKELPKGYKVIHIASHFSLNPGDATRSFLLLGDGRALTVSEIRTNEELLFDGVELLTLSACETAVVEKDGTGKEIEGFGYVAQQKGARAILATLWSVADESTQVLMSEFYRLRQESPQLTKAAALQSAQRAMLEGKLRPSKSEEVKFKVAGGASAGAHQPKFPYDPKTPYAHPYYWSPFILIGNWR